MASYGTRFDYPLDAATVAFAADFVGGLILGRHCKALVFYPDGTATRANVRWVDGVATLDKPVPAGATVTVYRETEPEHSLLLYRPGEPISAAALNALSRHVRMRLHELRELATKKPPFIPQPGLILTEASGAELIVFGLMWRKAPNQLDDPSWVDGKTVDVVGANLSSALMGHRFGSNERRFVILQIDRVSPNWTTDHGFEYGVVLCTDLDYWAARAGQWSSGDAPSGPPQNLGTTPLQATMVYNWSARALANAYASYFYRGNNNGSGYTSYGSHDGLNTGNEGGQSFVILMMYEPISDTDGMFRRVAWRLDTGMNSVHGGNGTNVVGAQSVPELAFFSRIGGNVSGAHIRQKLLSYSDFVALGYPAAKAQLDNAISTFQVTEVQ